MNTGPKSESRLYQTINRVYAVLLELYPAPFRQELGEEMEEVFADMAAEAAGAGRASLIAFALREALHTLAAVVRARWMRRGMLARRAWDAFLSLFQPGDGPAVDGRSAWAQAALEVGIFVLVGTVLVVNTYLPLRGLPAFIQGGLVLAGALALLAPLLWLFAGVARGMPRWAFPLVGWVLVSSLLYALPIFMYAIAAAMALVLIEALFGHRKKKLPASLKRFARRLASDPSLISFAIYGIMPVAVVIAFDDMYVNNHTSWYFAAVAGMIAGALLYSRSSSPILQTGSLLLGISLIFLASGMDRASFTNTAWPDTPWFLTLWANLLFITSVPPALGLLYRLLFRRKPAAL